MPFIRRNARSDQMPGQNQPLSQTVRHGKKGARTISEARSSGKDIPAGGKQRQIDTANNRKVGPMSETLKSALNRLKGCQTLKSAMRVYHSHNQQLSREEGLLFTKEWQDKVREVAFPYFFELLQIKKANSQGLQIAATKGELEAFHNAFSLLIDKGIMHPDNSEIDAALHLKRTKEALQSVQLSTINSQGALSI
ncbi:hypothetical protein [Endozoicomonas sp.]|uniref:hypothetical protein n=1 Tax=Endozoicomonas sp. TaxID=1892382 RepID=UPI003AF84BD2